MSRNPDEKQHAFDRVRQAAGQETANNQSNRNKGARFGLLQSKMFWVIVAGFTVVIVSTVIFVNWILMSLASSNYTKEMQIHQLSMAQENAFVAAVQEDGTVVSLQGQNLTRALNTLSVSDHRILWRTPNYNEDEAIHIILSTGAEFTVAPDPEAAEDSDKAFVIYEHNDKTTRFSIEGYNTIYWLEAVTGPEGSYGPNQVVRGLPRLPD